MNAPLVSEKRIGRQFVFSLALAVFGTGMLDVLSSLFLIDIANTFLGDSSLSSIAIVSQVVTISSIAAVVFGVLNGFLSVRVNHKKLLLLGVLLIIIGTVGCYLSPSLVYMGIFYPFDGAGTIIVSAMAFTLVGESLPFEKRGKSIGIVTAGGVISSAAGFAVAGYIVAFGGWRSYLLWYVLPISLIAIGLAYASIPSEQRKNQSLEKDSLLSGFKEVLTNKSAAACLFSYTLGGVAAMWAFFAATFWMKQFYIEIQYVGLISLVTILLHAAGNIIGGRIIDFFGRKPLAVTSWTTRGLLLGAIVFMPDFWSALAMSCIFMFVAGISVISGHCLNVEQVHKSKGTMMSLSMVFGYLGASLGAAFGALVLGLYGFQGLAITFGSLNLAGAITFLFFARDPTQVSRKN